MYSIVSIYAIFLKKIEYITHSVIPTAIHHTKVSKVSTNLLTVMDLNVDRCKEILILEENSSFPGKVHCHDTFNKIYTSYINSGEDLSRDQFFKAMIENDLIVCIVYEMYSFIIIC